MYGVLYSAYLIAYDTSSPKQRLYICYRRVRRYLFYVFHFRLFISYLFFYGHSSWLVLVVFVF